MRHRSGVTMIELMVALAILAIALAVVPAALRPLARAVPDPVSDARRAAVRSGQRQTRVVQSAESVFVLTALPDGRVIAGRGIDPLTGRKQ